MKKENKYPLDNPAKSSPMDRKKSPERILKEKKEKKTKRSKRLGITITIIQGILTSAVLGLLLTIDLLPLKYMAIVFLVLALAFVFTWKTQGHRGIHIVGKLFGILTIPVFAIAIYGLILSNIALHTIANNQEKEKVITDTVFSIYINDGGDDKIWMINTETHQILEVTTPSKYYISIPGVTEGKKDTLENTRKHNADAIKVALGTLYETTIPYNVNIQMTEIEPSLIVKPRMLIDVVDSIIETNLSKGQIRQLVKLYMKEEVVWDLCPMTATGFGTRQKTYTNPGEETLVMEPDKQSVEYIIGLMNRVEDGEKLKDTDLK